MHTFSDIVGHAQVKRSLQNALSQGRPAHAYAFVGMKGVGKKTMANAFAKALQCAGGGVDCCGQCISCISFDSGNHPDVIYVGLKDKKSLGVEEIREQLVNQATSKQYQYQYKIFIVENADAMTVAAQNALLKTLEEPPGYAVFILLLENKERLLPTILSRVVLIPFRPQSMEDISSYLVARGHCQREQATLYAAISQGSIGQALELAASPAFFEMQEDIGKKLASIPRLSFAECISMAKELEIYKDSGEFLDMIYLWYRDLLAIKKTGDSRLLIQKNQEERLFNLAAHYREENILAILDAVWQARGQLRQNASFLTVLEVCLIKLKESSHS